MRTPRLTHYAGEREAIDAAMKDGTPVTAACGKKWVPSRNPEAYDLCPPCAAAVRRGWCA